MMELFIHWNKFYIIIVVSALLLFITKHTALGLTEADAKNEYDQVEMPLSARDFNPDMPKVSLRPFIVELAIVCDKDFGDLFQHNKTKILNYWKVYIWDVNNRFKTLNKTNITFHIASLRVLSPRHNPWQPIENAKEGGKVSLAKFLPEFAEWAYSKRTDGTLVGYDVIIGVTGLSYTGIESGYSYRNGSCNFSQRERHFKVYSTAVFTDKGDFRVGTLSHELAHILGAKHDYDCEHKPRYHIMDYSNWRGLHLQFRFSQCTDQDISDFLKYPTTSSCLKVQSANHIRYRPNDDPEVNPPNMDEQCKMLLGNETAIFINPENSEKICQRIECGIRTITGEVELVRTYTPVDNSRCHKNGVCFRGICHPRLELETVSASGTSISIDTTTPTSLSSRSSTTKSILCQSSMLSNVIDTKFSTNASPYSVRIINPIYFVNIWILYVLVVY